jgi:uncharacterized protein YebE (UPF0316 family)
MSGVLEPILLCFLIFICRVTDVSLQTLRIIFVARNLRSIAPVVGFVEVSIWLFALRFVMRNQDNWIFCFFYAAGFAAGVWMGMLIENKLAIGTSLVRVITQPDAKTLIQQLKAAGFGVTSVAAQGIFNPVKLVYTIIKRKDIPRVIGIIKQHQPRAVFTIEDVQSVQEFSFQSLQNRTWLPFLAIKGKKHDSIGQVK